MRLAATSAQLHDRDTETQRNLFFNFCVCTDS